MNQKTDHDLDDMIWKAYQNVKMYSSNPEDHIRPLSNAAIEYADQQVSAERDRINKLITNQEGNNHLEWIYDRLLFAYNNSENVYWMIKFRKIIDSL